MKKFLFRIAVFFAIVAIVDIASGRVLNYLQSGIAGGRTYAEYHACKESDEDILIMGSSKASHHYVPQVLEDTLGLSCFNCGQDGNGIILQYGRWKMISARYSPKMILYDVTASFDIDSNDNMRYMDRLKPYCDDKNVRNYIGGLFPFEKLKLLSNIYRYNYKFLEIISDCGESKAETERNGGYLPLNGALRQEIIDSHTVNKASIEPDEMKLDCLEKLVKECIDRQTKIVFLVSPSFRGGTVDLDSFRAVTDLASRYDVPFLYYGDSEFSYQSELFSDSEHLNDRGAALFTSEVAHVIKENGYLD